MPRRLTVLFLVHPRRPSLFKPWGEDLIAAIGDRHDLRIFDKSKDIPDQFEGVDVVIDHGGENSRREWADLVAGKIKLWQVLGTGVDHFNLEYWRQKKIPVANTPGQFSSVALGECAMLLILLLARKFPVTQANFRSGTLYEPLGMELPGLKLGIVGFGASGRELARRAIAFGMKPLAIDIRDVGADEVREFGLEFVGKPVDLDRAVAEADVLSLHLHLNQETRHIIDARRIGLMKPSAFLVNVARGALVDEAALAGALIKGKIGGAGLDVFGQEPPDPEAPIYKLPNVVVTPHISGVTDGTSKRRARCCADNVDRVAAGLEPLYRVD